MMIDFALIDECKNPNVPAHIVKEIIEVESKGSNFAINVNQDGKSLVAYYPRSKQEAIAIAKEQIAKGLSVDLGLMQFNSNNLKAFNLNVDEILDPCTNIKAGSNLFFMAYKNTNSTLPQEQRIKKALSVYNTGSQYKGFQNGYVDRYKIFISENETLLNKAKNSPTRVGLSFGSFNLDNFKSLQNYE